MNEMFAIFAGIGLAAACGFRVFVPLFVASLAINQGFTTFGGIAFTELIGSEFGWLGSTPVTMALGIATALEIGSYYIPLIDNLLDAVASPAAVVAGTFISGTMLPEFLGDDATRWILAAILGGGSAGLVQSASVLLRGGSSITTGGLGNPAVSSAELGGAVVTAGSAVFIPLVAALIVGVIVIAFGMLFAKTYRRRLQAARNDDNFSE